MSTPAHIGVLVGRDLVGDALIKLPFLRALRHAFPGASINWITSLSTTAYASILREPTRDLIDHIYETPSWAVYPSNGQRAPHFDLLIDTRNRWKLARQAKKNIPHHIFLAPALRFLFSDRRPPLLARTPKHMVDRMLQLVELAAGYLPPSAGSLPVPEPLMFMARQMLPEGPSYVGLAPGAGNAIKIWPRHRFSDLAIEQTRKGRTPVFLLGPQELDWHNELQHAVPDAKFPLQEYDAWGTAQLTIDHTFAVAKCLTAAVANDSGVGNMLGAMDCRLVSLFGPTSADKLAPRVTRGRVVKAQDFGGETAMSAIPVSAVMAALEDVLCM